MPVRDFETIHVNILRLAYSFCGVLFAELSVQNANAGFQQYDQTGYGVPGQEVGVKAKIIDLISAVRTLMRSKSRPVLVALKF